ncbi:MAG: oligosaccharide flippase family protein [Desulfobulbaceae bacterium]|nr:MAG: oligosaccharide flippase family protein [Desulfobulbaceae bacterium]
MTTPAKTSGLRQMVGHASIYAAGNIMRQLVGFLMLPIYTRYLTPADYGVIGLMTFAISLIEPLFGARLGMAIPKYYADAEAQCKKALVVSTALLTTGSVSVLTTLVLIYCRQPAAESLFGSAEYATIVGLFAVLITTQALEYDTLIFIRLQQRPWLFVGVNLVKLIVQLSLNIWLVVFKQLGVYGIAISAMSSSVFFAVILICYTFYHVGFHFDKIVAQKMIIFCWPLWLAGLVGLYIGSSNRYFLKIFSSLGDIGLFELAVKFSAIISMLIWEPFQQYWQIERFRNHKEENAKEIFQNVFYAVSNILAIVSLGVIIFSGPVIDIMASADFYKASYAVPFLTAGTFFSCLSTYFNFSFFVTENTKWMSRINYLVAIVITFFYFIFIPLWGFVGAALAVAIAQAVQFVVVYRLSSRFYDMEISLKSLGHILLIAGVACGCTSALLLAEFDFWGDVFTRTVVYALAVIFIIYPIWLNPSTRAVIHDIALILRRKRSY